MCKDIRETGGMKHSSCPRPYRSMISPRYRQREERRKMLKISAGKLSRIDDPEASLCRSVLINNTLRRLRRDPAAAPPPPQQPDFAQDVPVDEHEECEDTSMFCVPPTPRLLTSIDEDDAQPGKRPRTAPCGQEFASCGQASLLDGAVFHSLMTSLETT